MYVQKTISVIKSATAMVDTQSGLVLHSLFVVLMHICSNVNFIITYTLLSAGYCPFAHFAVNTMFSFWI